MRTIRPRSIPPTPARSPRPVSPRALATAESGRFSPPDMVGLSALQVAGGSGVASAAADAPRSRFARRIGFHGLRSRCSLHTMAIVTVSPLGLRAACLNMSVRRQRCCGPGAAWSVGKAERERQKNIFRWTKRPSAEVVTHGSDGSGHREFRG